MWRRVRSAPGADAGTRGEAIVAEISAQEIGGQIAVGSNNLQISADHGAIVTVAAPAQAPVVRPRPVPVALQPRDAPQLLGRERELDEALAALAGGETVVFAGPPGSGKTSLLRRISHAGAAVMEHGVVFLRAAGQPVADVERFLFDAFYEADAPCQPTPAELRGRLADRRALVVLDDVGRERDDVGELLDCAPCCRFLLASERRCLSGDGRELELSGLGADAALALLERELGRPLRERERAPAAELCERVGGRPLSILQAAALARSGELPLVASTSELEDGLRRGFEHKERRVLRALELLEPAAIAVADVAAIAQVPDAAAVLERLCAAGAAQEQEQSRRWTAALAPAGSAAAAPVGPAGSGTDDDGAAQDAELLRRARKRLAAGMEERLLEDVPAILAALLGGGEATPWEDVLALARAADPLLARCGRWGAWAVALERALRAAEATGDRAATAWALHQLGPRACLLGDDAGRPQREQALALRHELGDEAGAAVTAHNLGVLFGGPPEPPDGTSWALWAGIGAGVLALGVAAALLLSSSHGSSTGSLSQVAKSGTRTTPTPRPPATGTQGGNSAPIPPPAGTRLAIDGDLSFVTRPRVAGGVRAQAFTGVDASRVHGVSVVNLGPAAIAVVPSIDNPAFAILDDRCLSGQPVPVRQGCSFVVSFHGNASTSGTLRFQGSPTTAPVSAEVVAPSPLPTTSTETAPPSTGTTTTTTTTSGGTIG